MRLIRRIGGLSAIQREKVAELLRSTTEQRVAALMLDFGPGTHKETQVSIAKQVFASRAYVSTTITRFVRAGIVSRGRSWEVLQASRLKELAGPLCR